MLKKSTPSLGTRYLVVKRFNVTLHHPQIRGKGQVVELHPGKIVYGRDLGAELTKIAYYAGMITDSFKINKAGLVLHPEDKTEKATAIKLKERT